MDSSEFEFRLELPREVELALATLAQHGFVAYVVGGAVRDALLGAKPHDFDIASPSTPAETMKCFPGYAIDRSGLKHGTVRVIIHRYPVEITTFRTESDYGDFRHPGKVAFVTSPFTDSTRRDFTFNAFYYRDGKVLDFHHGIDDLKAKTIRTIGDPAARFKEDALRILRALRFAAEYGFAIDPATKKAMAACAPELLRISAERIDSELLRTAAYPDFLQTVAANKEVFEPIFGGIEELPDKSLALEVSHSPFVNLALLLWLMDTKPATAEALLAKLRFATDNAAAIVALLAIDRKTTIGKLAVASTLPLRLFLLMIQPLNPEIALEFVKLRDEEQGLDVSGYGKVRDFAVSPVGQEVPVAKKDLMVTGNDLKRLGFKPGPSFRDILEELLLAVNQQKVGADRKSQLQWLRKKLG